MRVCRVDEAGLRTRSAQFFDMPPRRLPQRGCGRREFGDIVAAGAAVHSTDMFEESCAIAAANGFAPSQATIERSRAMLTASGSAIAASMLRDIERGAPIEADHIVGDLLQRRNGESRDTPLLRIAYAHLKAYEARRKRETAAAAATELRP